MAEVLHANIFFFITSIAVIVFTVLLSVALYHVIKILASVRRIVDRIEAGTETLVEDLEGFRTYVMEESLFARFFHAMIRHKAEPSSRKRSTGKSERGGSKTKTELKIRNEE